MRFDEKHRTNLQTARLAVNEKRNAERLEDVTWMHEGGENLTGAAKRLGISTEALRVWLRRHSTELGLSLAAREPRDPNQRPGIEAMRGKRWAS